MDKVLFSGRYYMAWFAIATLLMFGSFAAVFLTNYIGGKEFNMFIFLLIYLVIIFIIYIYGYPGLFLDIIF